MCPLTPNRQFLNALDIYKKRGANLSLVPRVKAFALPGLSKRATLKAPR